MPLGHTIRVTGVLLDQDRLLLVEQRVSEKRGWSLPGGKLEAGETLEEGLLREMREETGLEVRIVKPLYLCDLPEHHVVHVTFLVACDDLDRLRPPTNEHETTPIGRLAFVAPEELPAYGFSPVWARLVADGFPDTPCYAGHKRNIGL